MPSLLTSAPPPRSRIVHFPTDIYLTHADYEQLTELVRQEPPAGTPRALAAVARELTRAHLVTSYAIIPSVISLNSRVTLRHVENGTELTLSVVLPSLADETRHCFSLLHPPALSLLRSRLHDRVSWPTLQGTAAYRVEAIVLSPDKT